MSGDQLTLRSPQGRVIVPYVGDHAAIADRAAQLQTTGEQTLELHRFVMSIIDGDIAVQDGISVAALQEMALTVGDGLRPLGQYLVDLATATWAYADACRIAGDLTKHMVDRVSNLQHSLATLVEEREATEGWQADARSLPEDGVASGYLIPYSVLNEEGILNAPSSAVVLDGMPKEQALRNCESRLGALQTLHDSVHRRNDEMLGDFDAAVSDWEAEADAFVRALDGILGVLADTAAEDQYQRLGDVGEVAAWVGTAADVGTLIPFPPFAAAAALVGLLATAMEVAANGGQALKARYQPGDDSIRVVEGQVVGEGEQTAVAASGFVPVVDLLRTVTRASDEQAVVAGAVETSSGAPVDGEAPARRADLPVDVGVSTDPIDAWQPEADASNPRGAYSPGHAMPTPEERAASVAPAPAPAPRDDDVEPLQYDAPERPSIADLPTTPSDDETTRVQSFEEIMDEHG